MPYCEHRFWYSSNTNVLQPEFLNVLSACPYVYYGCRFYRSHRKNPRTQFMEMALLTLGLGLICHHCNFANSMAQLVFKLFVEISAAFFLVAIPFSIHASKRIRLLSFFWFLGTCCVAAIQGPVPNVMPLICATCTSVAIYRRVMANLLLTTHVLSTIKWALLGVFLWACMEYHCTRFTSRWFFYVHALANLVLLKVCLRTMHILDTLSVNIFED